VAHSTADEKLAEQFFGTDAVESLAVAGRDVIDGERVRLVYHDPEGGWWFSSGGAEEEEELAGVCLPCLLHDDPNLVELSNLPLNWVAERGDEHDVWLRQPRPDSWGNWEPEN